MSDEHVLNFSQRHKAQNSEEDFPFFSCLRQQGTTPPMINFIMRSGDMYGLPTSALGEIWLRPGQSSLSLQFHQAQVEITGKNLYALYEKLLLRKVREIREIILFPDKEEKAMGEEDLFITRIEYFSENIQE